MTSSFCQYTHSVARRLLGPHNTLSCVLILEWIQGFGMYMAVLSRKQLERIPDLLAYQSIIIEGYLKFEGDGWDDHCLWQKAVAEGGGVT